jgi:drug/metabolite transporter (DMT)-like permease
LIDRGILGDASCLAAASVWAITVAMFRGPIERFGARTVNLAKCAIASVLLGATLLVLGRTGGLGAAAPGDLFLVAVSGLVGLTIGDSALFAAVRRLGPYRALLLQTLAPIVTVALASGLGGESLGPSRALGIALTLGGVALVVAPRREKGGTAAAAGIRSTGIAFGLLAAVGQGSGIVLAKAGMTTLPTLHSSFVRLAAAAVGLAAVGLLDGTVRRGAAMARAPEALGRVVPAAILGSYAGIFLMMFGVGNAPASVAAVLLSMTPVLSLFIDVARGRERLTTRSVAGTVLAIAGVGVLTSS